jgi:hypothetical protein
MVMSLADRLLATNFASINSVSSAINFLSIEVVMTQKVIANRRIVRLKKSTQPARKKAAEIAF